jgi:transcription antitermination factor NusG
MTKPRQEKSVARDLLARGVPFYLPLVGKDNRIRGRRVRSQIPLFAGYVFLFGDEDDRVSALQTNRISQMLPVADQHRLRSDLQQIERLIEANAPLTVERRLQPGKRVRIKSGPMLGLEGTVTVRRSRFRLLVEVHFLQSGVSIEIDDFMLEPID